MFGNDREKHDLPVVALVSPLQRFSIDRQRISFSFLFVQPLSRSSGPSLRHKNGICLSFCPTIPRLSLSQAKDRNSELKDSYVVTLPAP